MPVEILAPGSQFIQAGDYVPSPWKISGEEQKARYWKAVDRRRSRWAGTYAQQIRRLFEQEWEDLLESFRSADAPDLAMANLEAAAGEWEEEWVNLFMELYQTVAESFARTAQRRVELLVGKRANIIIGRKSVKRIDRQVRISQWLSSHAAQKVKDIQATTMQQIRDALREGLEHGEGVWDLSQRIEKLGLEEIIPRRSEVIARTETMHAGNMGSHLAAQESSEELRQITWKEWISTRDDRTRDGHLEADGQKRQMYPEDEPYDVDGEQMMFPMDDGMGASAGNIIQCRCTEAYEVGELLEEVDAVPGAEREEAVLPEAEVEAWESDVRNMIDAIPQTADDYERIGKRITDDILNDPDNRASLGAWDEIVKNRQILNGYNDAIVEAGAGGDPLSLSAQKAIGFLRKRNEELSDLIVQANKNITEQTYSRLQKLREFGGEKLNVHVGHRGAIKEKIENDLNRMRDYFPRRWVEASNYYSELTVKKAARRAQYDPTKKLMTVNPGVRGVYVHEYGHRMENVIERVKKMGVQWRESRRLGEANTWLGQGYRKKEVGFRDKFFHPYIGKDYGRGYSGSEVISMGMEYLVKAPVSMLMVDPGHYRFIVGLLAAI